MLTLIWDVDDVLNDLMLQWFTRGWLQEHPECLIGYSQLSQNPPHRVLGVTREEYLASLDAFGITEAGVELTPNAQVLSWFTQYGSKFRHVALTARPLESAPKVAQWVMRHFGAWVRCFGVVPTRSGRDVPIYDRSKGEYLQWLNCGGVLVDDSAENISQAASLGMKTLLFPQPWNGSTLTTSTLLQHLSEMAGES